MGVPHSQSNINLAPTTGGGSIAFSAPTLADLMLLTSDGNGVTVGALGIATTTGQLYIATTATPAGSTWTPAYTWAAVLTNGNTTAGGGVANPTILPTDELNGVHAAAGSGAAGGVLNTRAGAGDGAAAGGVALHRGGTGGATGAGGSSELRGGDGGATSGNGALAIVRGGLPVDGNGGGVIVRAREGATTTATNRNGGATDIDAGNAVLAGTGGSVTMDAGGGGATGTAGNVDVRGGAGGTTSGNAGNATIRGGVPVDGNGGSASLAAAAGVGANRGGGNVNLTAGASTGAGASGFVLATGGLGGATSSGGVVVSRGGAGGTTSGPGGAVRLEGGNATAGNSTGGDIEVTGGTPTGTGRRGVLDANRFSCNRGTALVAGDFALDANWGGAGAAIAVAANSQDGRWRITITVGAGPGAAPVCTLTFRDLGWPRAPFAFVARNGGTGALVLTPTWTTTATTLVLTQPGLPIAGETYIYECVALA